MTKTTTDVNVPSWQKETYRSFLLYKKIPWKFETVSMSVTWTDLICSWGQLTSKFTRGKLVRVIFNLSTGKSHPHNLPLSYIRLICILLSTTSLPSLLEIVHAGLTQTAYAHVQGLKWYTIKKQNILKNGLLKGKAMSVHLQNTPMEFSLLNCQGLTKATQSTDKPFWMVAIVLKWFTLYFNIVKNQPNMNTSWPWQFLLILSPLLLTM